MSRGSADGVGMLALTLAYDGADFAGSQVQPGQRTVQGELARALAAIGYRAARTTFAGRTDRGVHAAGQVVGISDCWPERSAELTRRAINAHLPGDVGVVAVERRPCGFHARFDATWRQYRYMIGQEARQPIGRHWVWFRPGPPLDVSAMRLAAERFRGTRDCAAIAGQGAGVPWSPARDRPRGTVRTIIDVVVRPVPPWWTPRAAPPALQIDVTADGFLPRMVRNIVAMLTEVGRGAKDPAWITLVLDGQDRRAGGGTAPPHGLSLWRIGYGNDSPRSSDTT